MTTFLDIEVGLQTKLNSISGKPFIDFEGMPTYDPVMGVRFWRTTNLAGNSSQITADAIKQHLGVYQVDVFIPRGKGLKVLLNDIDLIATNFDTVNSIESGNISIQILGVSRGQVREEESFLHGFVKINYVCYSN